MKRLSQQGIAHLAVILVIVVLAAIGGVGYSVMKRNQSDKKTPVSTNDGSTQQTEESDTDIPEPQELIWMQTGDGWTAGQNADKIPKCPEKPLMKAPVNMTAVTSILYPGQTRGGNYKPHGGFRFDNATDNAVTVTAPMDGYVVRGARYIAEGDVQYTFDVINNCGIMYRLGHLLTLDARFQSLAERFPPASEDSRTSNINPAFKIKAGDTIATKVGIGKTKNTFVDLGVYDLRSPNKKSKDAAWAANSAHDKELAQHAVCWLNGGYLPSSDEAKIKGLPAGDPGSGKNSDYCE
jgi:hypothetical protein